MARSALTGKPPLLEMHGIDKSYPGVRALDGVSLSVQHGEVVALLGENGAGKSTLIKMLGGAHQPDRGNIRVAGEEVNIDSPAAARLAGIGVIFQEFNLVPELAPWENIFLGRETGFGFVRRETERWRAAQLFQQTGVDVPMDVPCGQLSVAQQQIVEIVKALSQNARLIVMDEPSAALTTQEVACLFDIIRDLKRRNIGVIYISHRMDEIFQISDRVAVLRDGQLVGTAPTGELDRKRLIEMMVGRNIEEEFPETTRQLGPARLVVRGLKHAKFPVGLDFEVRRGEVLGVTGLIGAGRTELARLIFGADHLVGGSVTLDGTPLDIRSPRDAILAGICLLTEDRKQQGLIMGASICENFGLPNLSELSYGGFVRGRQERVACDSYAKRLNIKMSHSQQLVGNLSGGNQQKVVLAKWLQRNAEVVIFDEPTRGVDVGSKYEIYALINELAKQGKAIIMISSELPEILGMSDRILVMHEGRITGTIQDTAAATQEQIMEFAAQ
ncbi:MAG: sugar ABC transporter ATP-binding protein [Pirellulales bacterium]|nr:sugar ABC transporter ATP-binding protein [Pirellulales bacterium]